MNIFTKEKPRKCDYAGKKSNVITQKSIQQAFEEAIKTASH